MFLFYGGLCVNFDIIGEISHGSNRTRVLYFDRVVRFTISICTRTEYTYDNDKFKK